MTGFNSKRASARDKLQEQEMDTEVLMDKVLEQIRTDIANEDATAIYELLAHLPKEVLRAYLPEEDYFV